MYQNIKFSVFLVTLLLSKVVIAQTVWSETFDIPEKGYWANASGILQADLSGANWMLDVSACKFEKDGDYAKTVTTSGGRFEVKDSEGNVRFLSPILDISKFDAVDISLTSQQTGSGTNPSKKFIKTYYKIDNGPETPFATDSALFLQWEKTVLSQKGLTGDSLQLVLIMNSSYEDAKVIVDDIKIEGIDSALFKPSKIELIQSPLFAFTNDTIHIKANVKNGTNETLTDSSLLEISGNNFIVATKTIQNGVYDWGIATTKKGQLDYSISCKGNETLAIDSSITIFLKKDAKLIETFEKKLSSDWVINQEWAITAENAINGSQSVKHLKQEDLQYSELIYNGFMNGLQLNENELFFSFKVKNGNWDPTFANNFYLLLCEVKPDGNPIDGYAIGVNAAESSDLVSLWRVKNGEIADLICETTFDWNENMLGQISVYRTATGNWTLLVTDLNTGMSGTATGFNNQTKTIHQIKFAFNYTVTRAGLIWFDDLLVVAQNAAPFIKNIVAESENQVVVEFNEPVNVEELSKNNFTITGESGAYYSIENVEKITSSKVKLTTNPITEPYLLLSATGIKDTEKLTAPINDVPFVFTLKASAYDLIFTEIMADPSPVAGLPENEYLEIYNRSNKFINLENFKLFVKNSEWGLPQKIILPGNYLILCNKSDSLAMASFGQVLALNTLPALLNSGSKLKLISPEGVVCEELTYSEKWYNDINKSIGGFSLERIDLNRMCGHSLNWTASNDAKGGSPGKINSVTQQNVDNTAPQLLEVDILSRTELDVYFNEVLDSLSAISLTNYTIRGIDIKSISYERGDSIVKIETASPINSNTEYTLNVFNVSDECGNVSSKQSSTFLLSALAKGDVVINEILFNPYSGGADFVELYNKKNVAIDLADLKLATRNDSLIITSVCDVSDLHRYFQSNSFLAFSKDIANIKETYSPLYPDNVIQMSRFPSYNDIAGSVVLLNDSMEIIDEFLYNKSMHVAWLADMNGVSLERLSVDRETNDPLNWHSASSLVGYATPGYANSQSDIEEGQKNSVEMESNIVSPNGDGFNDKLILTFKIDQTGYLANVYIFDAAGREVNRLTNNDLLGNNSKIEYDLKRANGTLLPLGTYLIYTELTHISAKRQLFKQAFLVTDNQ
jgi:hypothetical protein